MKGGQGGSQKRVEEGIGSGWDRTEVVWLVEEHFVVEGIAHLCNCMFHVNHPSLILVEPILMSLCLRMSLLCIKVSHHEK